MARKIRKEDIENLGTYYEPRGIGIISGSDQLTGSYDTRYSLSGSGGITTEQSERITNQFTYLFTTSSGSETLTSSVVKPDTTPDRGKYSWRTYMYNSIIKFDNSLPINTPFILEASSLTTEMIVLATGSVKFYGESSGSYIKKTDQVTGLTFTKGNIINCVKEEDNLYRIDGNWDRNDNMYDTYNVLSIGNESNSLTGITSDSNVDIYASTEGPPYSGDYCLKVVAKVDNVEGWVYIVRPSGMTPGTYTLKLKMKATGAGNNYLSTRSENQWSVTKEVEQVGKNTGAWEDVEITDIVLTSISNADSGRLRLFIRNNTPAPTIYYDALQWIRTGD